MRAYRGLCKDAVVLVQRLRLGYSRLQNLYGYL